MLSNNYKTKAQLDTLSAQIIMSSFGSILLGGTVLVLFWSEPIAELLISWFFVLTVSCLVNSIFTIKVRKNIEAHLELGLKTYAVLGLIAGLIWAILPLWSISGEPEAILPGGGTVFIIIIVIGLATSALGSNTSYLPFYYAAVSPFLLSTIVACFVSDVAGLPLQYIGFALVLFLVVVYYFAFNINKSFIESIELRNENKTLLSKYIDEKQKAEEANRQKSKFLAAASHDLRQPMQSLTFYSELLVEQVKSDLGQDLLKSTRESIHTLNVLLNSLLDLSKLDSGALKPSISDFPVSELFTKLDSQYSEQAKREGIKVTLLHQDNWLRSDFCLLLRVLNNVVENALVHADAKRILIAARQQKDQVLLYVFDDGIGVGEQQKKKVFEEFKQLNNDERNRSKGLGLGLSIVERTLGILEHKYNFRSDLDRGCQFIIQVDSGEAQQPKTHSIQAANSLLTNLSVWLIDDEREIRDSLGRLLTSWGATMISASGHADIHALLSNESIKAPDLIVSDYRLPENIAGDVLLLAIREHFKKAIPAIVITGDSDKSKINTSLLTTVPILQKPITGAKLRMAIARVLN